MENERKLAHIEVIEWIKEIPGADKICTYGILGWEVIDQKGKYNVGDKVIYCEVDSILPDKPEFEFLRDRKFRIRTIKLRGQVSQGLVLPISILGQDSSYFSIGHDVTELLGITKYLTPSEEFEQKQFELNILNSKKWYNKYKWLRRLHKYKWFRKAFFPTKETIGNFPSWVAKTDEERIQNIPYVLEQFKDKEVYVTEKIDYQSVTFTGKMIPRFNNWFGRKMFNLVQKWQ